VVLEFELRALCLLGKCSAMSQTLFTLVIFQMESHVFPGTALDLPTSISCVLGLQTRATMPG
jgi:hypothetical protein